jgi:hypothetical protein
MVICLFTVSVSIVFGVIAKDNVKDRTLYGIKVFGEFMGIGLALSWVLYIFPL